MTRKKVLLADDVNLFIELEKTFFRREGFQVLVARNGQEALEAVRTEKPDLVFMDLYMPGMNGDEACRLIKEDLELRSIPVIMVTHGGREDDLERCRRSGCDDIVLKPIDRHRFLGTARKYLEVADRAAPRVEGRMRIRFGPEGQPFMDAMTANLGRGGVFIESKEGLPEGDRLEMVFPVPDGEEIRCRGEVAWINPVGRSRKPSLPPGMGVKFLDLSEEDLKALQSRAWNLFIESSS